MATTTPIELKRHHTELSEKETDEVIATVADLIVNFLKGSGGADQRACAGVSATRQEVQP